jgi:hypothetical protein
MVFLRCKQRLFNAVSDHIGIQPAASEWLR